MSTPELIDRAGVLPVAVVLLLTLAVTLLRLVALPLAAAVAALDGLAALAAAPLTLPGPPAPAEGSDRR